MDFSGQSAAHFTVVLHQHFNQFLKIFGFVIGQEF